MRITLSLCDFKISLKFKNASVSFLRNIADRYSGFRSYGKGYSIDVYIILDILIRKLRVVEKPLYVVGEGFVFEEIDDCKGNLFLVENLYFFENFIRVFLSHKLISLNGFLIHSAGFFYKGNAVLFPGKSGSGKTTLSMMLKDYFKIMSDEICGVVRKDDGFKVFSTPFWGNFKRPVSQNIAGELKSIVFIRKSHNPFIIKADFKYSLKMILKTLVNFTTDYYFSYKAAENISDILRLLPSYIFGFDINDRLLDKRIRSFFDD